MNNSEKAIIWPEHYTDIISEAANAAEMKAAATGNELVFQQVQLAAKLKKMEAVYASFLKGQHQLENKIGYLEKKQARCDERIARYKVEIELRQKDITRDPYFAIDGKIYGK